MVNIEVAAADFREYKTLTGEYDARLAALKEYE